MYTEHPLTQEWLVACQASQLKKQPKSFEILGKRIVIFRSGKAVRALEDRCPHRNAPLSGGVIRNGNIQCPYHGWEFSEFGECLTIPGLGCEKSKLTVSVPSFLAVEKDNLIWVNFDSSADECNIPAIQLSRQDIAADSFVITSDIHSTLMNALENFLDGFHTPFVHAALIRTPATKQEVKARITAGTDRVEIEYSGETGQSGWLSRLFENRRTLSYGRFIRPSIAQLEYCDLKGTSLLVTVFFTPIRNGLHRIHAVIETPRRKIPAFIKNIILKSFFLYILKQDKDILRIQRENIDRFGGEQFTSTRVDFIRPYIIRLLQTQHSPNSLQNQRVEGFYL